MNYIVMDLEWNQAMRSDSAVFNKLPIHLRGEIIEIGAVKLNPDMTPGEEFTIDVRPQFFRRIHYKVKKITGFDKERLAKGTDAEGKMIKRVEDGVQEQIDLGNFRVYLQPKVSIRQEKTVGAEALIRLFDDVHGMISPEVLANTMRFPARATSGRPYIIFPNTIQIRKERSNSP